jgi:hypothetical protein
MKNAPAIQAGDWITVGSQDCVVKLVYESGSPFGRCLVVFNKVKPTTHDVDWNDNGWFFPQRPDFGGYAQDNDPYVQQLKQGRR